ncbi:MAG: TVP38/TMEM64 family protein [Clostridia bacterium]|nr:TVP38/TMEM64 family protein [Clostridia bacterium]
MKLFKRCLFYIVGILLILLENALLLNAQSNMVGNLTKYILIFLPHILFVLSILFKIYDKKLLYKLFISVFYLLNIIVIAYLVLLKLNIISMFSSINGLKNYILSTKEKGVFVYILIQLLQVVFLPIPASIICIVGSLIYGPILGSIYCCIGVLGGSYISYFLGKIFGYKLVAWIVGKDNTDKYSEIIQNRGFVFLALAFLLPMFPDDILCFIAGITQMKTSVFFWVTLITRPIGVVFMAIFGGGHIIPFNGWGLYAWGAILLVAVAFVYIIYRWQDQLQEFIISKIFHKSNKSSKN